MKKILNYIDGKLVEPKSGKFLDNMEPATGKAYSLVADSDGSDVAAAVAAAKKAFPVWSKKSLKERSVYLKQIGEKIRERIDEFAQAESIDNGKPLWLAKAVDIPRAILNFEFFSEAYTLRSEDSYIDEKPTLNYIQRLPLGVVGTITPWNLPLYLFTWKIAPAVALGNCVVAKPSEVTPMTAFLFSEVCKEVGLPDGVINVIHGSGANVGSAITESPDVKAISFTGSTQTGRAIAQAAASQFKKTSLEMGGKNPTIVFEDADFDRTVSETARAAFANQGQICLCGSRIIIQKSIYEKFKSALVQEAEKWTVGDPSDEGTKVGALVSKPHMEKVLSCIEMAKKEGGKILCGGSSVKLAGRCENGYFVAPTLIEGLDSKCRTNQEEIFGPVATLIPFDTEEEAIEIANSTAYGLAGSVWTQDISKGHRVAGKVDSGVVWVNCWMLRDVRVPFGGMKESGLGREGANEFLNFFTEPKNICVDWSAG